MKIMIFLYLKNNKGLKIEFTNSRIKFIKERIKKWLKIYGTIAYLL